MRGTGNGIGFTKTGTGGTGNGTECTENGTGE